MQQLHQHTKSDAAVKENLVTPARFFAIRICPSQHAGAVISIAKWICKKFRNRPFKAGV